MSELGEHYCHWRLCIRCTSCTAALQLLSERKFSKRDICPLATSKGKKDVAYFRAIKVVSNCLGGQLETVLLFSVRLFSSLPHLCCPKRRV